MTALPLPTEPPTGDLKPPFPNASNELDKWGIPRKSTPEQAKAAFENLKQKDMCPYQGEWGKAEQEAAIELLCKLAGLDVKQAAPLKVELKKASKYALNNATLPEIEAVIENMDAKAREWYKANGSPYSVAKKVVLEVCKLKSKQAKEAGKFLGWEEEQPPSAADEAKRNNYLKYLDL